MPNCVRCGKLIYREGQHQKLWCDGCRKLVDEELNGELSRPREYYFSFIWDIITNEEGMSRLYE